MKELEEKYINLLLNKCLNITSHKSLFISYNDLVKEFVNNIKLTAESLGIKDIYLCNDQDYEKRDILKTINKEDIKNNPIFNNAIWDEYAKKDACFLLIDSEIPHLMEGIPEDLVVEAMRVSRTTKPIYKEKQMKFITSIGIDKDHLRFKDHEKLAHYAKEACDNGRDR